MLEEFHCTIQKKCSGLSIILPVCRFRKIWINHLRDSEEKNRKKLCCNMATSESPANTVPLPVCGWPALTGRHQGAAACCTPRNPQGVWSPAGSETGSRLWGRQSTIKTQTGSRLWGHQSTIKTQTGSRLWGRQSTIKTQTGSRLWGRQSTIKTHRISSLGSSIYN